VQELASGGAKLTHIAPNSDASQGCALACPEAGVCVTEEASAMKQKTIPRYLLGLGVLVTIVVMGTALNPTARNAASTSPEIAHAAPAISAAGIDSYLSGKGGSTLTADLPVPYRSQHDDDSGTYKSVNCGPASLAMVLEYYGTYDTIANIRSHCKSGGGAVSYSEMIQGTAYYGFDSNQFTGWQISDLRNQIDNGRPVIVVVHYGDLPRLDTYTGAHWMVVKGFSTDGNSIILHDPDYWDEYRDQGANRVFSIDTFDTAWNDCSQDGNPNRSGIMVSGNPPPPSCPPENCTPGNEVGRDFFVQVLERLADVPVSDFAVDALELWKPYENTLACWNPLATTWYMEGSCDFNSVGVKHYLSQDMGTQATANTLALSHYDAIRKMLRRESFDREQIRQALITWSGGGGYVSNLLDEWEALWNDQCGDTTPPTGSITSPSSGSTFSDSLTAISDANDDRSGVNRVDFYLYYDGTPHQQTDNNGGDGWSVTWDLSGVAEQSGMWLDAWIYDNAGNSHHTNVVTDLRIDRSVPTPTSTPEPSDTTPPTNPTSCIELNGAQNNVWQNSIGHPTFSWSGADGTGSDIAGYYHTFSTDPNGTSDYFTTGNTFDFDFSTGWPTGVPYYLRVRTKDTSGNLATEWKTIFTFKYDPVPPTVSFDRANGISISTGQDVCGNVTNWTFEGTANDSGAGLDSIVFGAWGNNYGAGWNDTVGTSSPWSYSQNGLLGHNRIHFWATDEANNVSERQYIELYVDTVSPSTSASLNGTMGDNGWYRSSVQVTLFTTDYGSGGSGAIGGVPNHYIAGVDYTRYRIDGGSWQTYSGSFLVSSDGTHPVDYYSVDTVGNEESTRSLTIKIDTTPPSGSLSINRGASTSYSLNVVLGLSASDGLGSGVSQVRFSNSNPDWTEWETYAPEKAWKLTDGNGYKTVHVQFRDAAGNISSEYSTSILVDLYPNKPASQNYRIFKSVVGIGGEGKSSENYNAGNTTGQPAMGPAPERSQSSESFHLVTGYWTMQPWPLSADFNHDCKIDIEDIMQVASRWRCRSGDDCYHKSYDRDKDGDIDVVDIMLVVKHWGETCP
jgi:hypothetical protein